MYKKSVENLKKTTYVPNTSLSGQCLIDNGPNVQIIVKVNNVLNEIAVNFKS